MGNKSKKSDLKKAEISTDTLGDDKYKVSSFKDLNSENLRLVILNNRYAQLLILLVAIGFALRFYNLGFNSIWLDEGTTFGYAKMGFVEIWNAVIAEFHPPLFYWLEHMMNVFGDSEFVLRFMPALFGVLAVPVFYLIGSEVVNRDVGIITALLVTFSPFQIYYSQDARAYTMILLFFSISLLAYIYALKTREMKWWIIFGIASAIAFWAHYYTIIGTGVIVLHAIVTNYREILKNTPFRKGFLVSIILFVILSIPLLLLIYERYLELSASAPTYGVLGPQLITSSIISFSGFEWWSGVLFAVLFIVGVSYLYKKSVSYMALVVGLLLIPLIFSVILSAKITMNPRYLIFLLPVFYLGIASAYMPMKELIKNDKFIYAFMAVLVLVNIPFMATYYTSYTKNDWRGFSGQLGNVTEAGDVIVVLPGYMTQPLDYYYSNETDGTIELLASSGEELEAIYSEYPDSRLFFVVTGDINAKNPEGDAVEWLNANTGYMGQNMGIYLFAIVPQV